jgi:SH3-like domain-containing protein
MPFPGLAAGLRVVALILCVLLLVPVHAAAQTGPSGLPLPRFATTRSDPINVRVGPGTKYDIAWTYLKAGQPVEIIQEFDTWRKIRDVDGSEGWVHQNLLTGTRSAIVAPWSGESPVALLGAMQADAAVRAWLSPGLRVGVDRCDGSYCLVNASGKTETGGASSYTGYLPQETLWGAYQGERFE